MFSIIFLSSFLVDVDHYFYYIFKKKDLSFKNCLNFFGYMDKKYNVPSYKGRVFYTLCIFHVVEFLILIAILAFFSKIFLFIFIGFALHLFVDLFYLAIEKSKFRKTYSAIYFLYLKNAGFLV